MTMSLPSETPQRDNAAWFELPPAALEGVRTRRMFAFLLDIVILGLLLAVVTVVLVLLGIPTLGLAWFLIPLPFAFLPVVAVLYNGVTVSGRRMATPGMHAADLEVRLTDGAPAPFLIACLHAALFYVSWSILTPLILLVSLVALNKRCLHDMLVGVVVTRRRV